MNITSQKMKYDAEAKVIKDKIGDIEAIRIKLHLSKRKMAQLLMVDPSALTRWSQEPKKVPPHIYRSLQWYLSLVEKDSSWHPQNSFYQVDLQNQVLVLEKRLKELENIKITSKKDHFWRSNPYLTLVLLGTLCFSLGALFF